MRVSTSLASAYAVNDPREGARWMVEQAAAARGSALDGLFVGDHHSTGPGTYYQNTAIMGRLLAEWGDAPAGALYLLPLWHPVLVAEQVSTLASIARGPFIVQAAIGHEDNEFPALGVNVKHRPSRFEEALEIIRRLWAGETVSSSHRYQITEAHIAPLPPEPIEVWVGATASPGIARAAQLGDGWLAEPHLTFPDAAAKSAEFLERAQAAGRVPTAVAIRRDVYVGASDEEARALVEPVIAKGYRGFDPQALVYGSAETVAAAFRALGAMGYTEVVTRSLLADQGRALASLERLGEVRERVLDA